MTPAEFDLSLPPVWDGVTRKYPQAYGGQVRRLAVSDCARSGDLTQLMELLSVEPALLHLTRPGGTLQDSPLHEAVRYGAPVEVVETLVRGGAWLSLRNRKGQRSLDVARVQNRSSLFEILTPVLWRQVPMEVLVRIEAHFHEVIHSRASEWVVEHKMRLPQLEVLLESRAATFWFPVPGM